MIKRIAIIGGGIAGLAFAVHYKKLGGRADIYERSHQSGREGLGFMMLENGIEALTQLGLYQSMVEGGYPINHCQILDTDSNVLISEPLKGSFGVTRKAFIDSILSEIPEDWLHFDHKFSHFEWGEGGDAKAAIFEDGQRVEADIFLGCDGGRSLVRQQIFPNAQRSDIRVKELVSIIKSPTLVSGLKHQFIKYKQLEGGLAAGVMPADQEHIVWFIQYDSHKYQIKAETHQAKRQFALETVGNWPSIIGNLINLTNFDNSHIWKTSYLIPLERFYHQNVVLLGDAAHALLPFTSQGVNSAIVDAMMLSELLINSQQGFTVTALEHFSASRSKVVNKYLEQGIALQEEFLQPHHHQQKIPFAF